MSDAAVAPSTSGRRRAFFIVTGVFTAFVALFAFGWISLVVGWFESGDRLEHRVHDLGWGAVGGLLIAGGLVVQLRDPERKIAPMQQVAIAVFALVLASLLSAEFNPFAVIFIIFVGTIIWLHPARDAVLNWRPPATPALAGLALIAAIPLVIYAFDQIDIQKLDVSGFSDEAKEHWDEGHWETMAGLAFALPLTGLLASMKTTGWLITARLVGVASCVLGLASLIHDDYPSALDTGSAIAALLGGVAFIALAEWEARQGVDVRAAPPA